LRVELKRLRKPAAANLRDDRHVGYCNRLGS
jgi:hypothetical protein